MGGKEKAEAEDKDKAKKETREAIRVFYKDGCLHDAGSPYQCLDGTDYRTRDVEFFSKLPGAESQQFLLNEDLTISPKSDPAWVLGTEANATKVKFIARSRAIRATDPHVLRFEHLAELMPAQAGKTREEVSSSLKEDAS